MNRDRIRLVPECLSGYSSMSQLFMKLKNFLGSLQGCIHFVITHSTSFSIFCHCRGWVWGCCRVEDTKDSRLNVRNGMDICMVQQCRSRWKKIYGTPNETMFPNALGALIYPIYGQGELTQAFCRRAAVKGCIYVLRMPVIALLMEKESGHCKGVRLASGQDIFSQKLLVDPSFVVPVPVAPSQPDCMPESSQVINLVDAKQKVARGICIMKSSLKPDVLNFVFVYPPRSLYPEQVMAIRAVQIGSNLGVCPSGMFVLYLSTLCNDATQGKELLQAAIKSLFALPVSGNPENSSSVHSENMEEVKPTLLWSALYTQELVMGSFESINSTSMPDGNLNYNVLLDATVKLFHQMYPQEEFFPETTSPENVEDDDSVSLES